MSESTGVRWGWLRFMYLCTIIGAGALGASMLLRPTLVESMFGMPRKEPIAFGINGSVYVAFAVLSALGLRSPLKFAPVLLLQMCYKLVFLFGVILPLLLAGRLPVYGISLAVVFGAYILGDMVAIPFRRIFSKEPQ